MRQKDIFDLVQDMSIGNLRKKIEKNDFFEKISASRKVIIVNNLKLLPK